MYGIVIEIMIKNIYIFVIDDLNDLMDILLKIF